MNTNTESTSSEHLMHEPILVTMQDQEGGFFILPQGNGDTATIVDPNLIPDWVGEHIGEGNTGLASANLKEYRDWIVSRVGQEYYDASIPKDHIEFNHMQWDAVDNEGDIVVIAADSQARTEKLATILGFDQTVEGAEAAWDGMKADEVIITKSYADVQTDEASLDEVSDQKFGERQRKTGTQG